jgi:hypothetical protein
MFSSMEQEYAIYIDTGIFETRVEFPPALFHSGVAIHYNLVKRMQTLLLLST